MYVLNLVQQYLLCVSCILYNYVCLCHHSELHEIKKYIKLFKILSTQTGAGMVQMLKEYLIT